MTCAERLTRIEREAPAMPVTHQCKLLALPRSSMYYESANAVSGDDLRLMRWLGELHLKYPFMGSRRLRDEPKRLGVIVNCKRIQRLMQLMGLEALYPRKRTILPDKAHLVFPYRLKGLASERAQTRSEPPTSSCAGASSTFRFSTTLEANYCVEAQEEAMARYGVPEIFNTDQGTQFTSETFLAVLERNQIRISMNDKDRWRDNVFVFVFVERRWRSVKYEEVYLKAYEKRYTRHEALLPSTSISKIMDAAISPSTGKRPGRSIRPEHFPKRPDDPSRG